jgi:hypothetical protein
MFQVGKGRGRYLASVLGGLGRSLKLLLVLASTFLTSGLLEIYDQDFCSLLDMYVFRNGASSSTKGGVGL